MKKNSIRFIAALISLILAFASIYLGNYFESQSALVTDTNIVTGGRNRAITANEDEGVVYIATHDGTLQAFKDEAMLWSAEVVPGPYCRLYLSKDNTRLYAANEGQKVYVFDAADGKMLLEIPVGRNVVDIAVSSDEKRIAVATNTGRNKANVLIYSDTGELLFNNALKNTVLRGIEYGKADALMIANKRGEVTHITQEGENIKTYKANYDVVKTMMHGETLWVLTIDGTYHALDSDLEVVRKGRVVNEINAYIESIGVDKNGEYVFVGT
ncbi:MAG: PQQ-binding-like beta-propeller repeat protein, partial [Clostridia bacterium]|nr:PQQ-binding-like beta-propeller repeat protein [Clostridia bacterium]